MSSYVILFVYLFLPFDATKDHTIQKDYVKMHTSLGSCYLVKLIKNLTVWLNQVLIAIEFQACNFFFFFGNLSKKVMYYIKKKKLGIL